MLCRMLVICGIISLLIVAVRPVNAQSVRVFPWGGVSVRAPGVRVDVDQWGATSVRAPGTAVDAIPRRPLPLVLPGRIVPGRDSLPVLTGTPAERRRQQLAASERTLQRELIRFSTAASWQNYLKIPHEALLPAEVVASEPFAIGQLQKSLSRYDNVAQQQKYNMIARLASFETTHAYLAIYVRLLSETQPSQEIVVEQEAAVEQEVLVEELPTPIPQ